MGLGMNQIKTKPNINFKFKLFLSFFCLFCQRFCVLQPESWLCDGGALCVPPDNWTLFVQQCIPHPQTNTHDEKEKKTPIDPHPALPSLLPIITSFHLGSGAVMFCSQHPPHPHLHPRPHSRPRVSYWLRDERVKKKGQNHSFSHNSEGVHAWVGLWWCVCVLCVCACAVSHTQHMWLESLGSCESIWAGWVLASSD